MTQWIKNMFSTFKSTNQTPVLKTQLQSPTLSFLTYNIWFEDHNRSNRLTSIIQILQKSDADFICLQEVTKDFYQLITKCKWVKKYCYQTMIDPNKGYYNLLLSKYKCQFKRILFPSSQFRRYLLIAETVINKQPFAVATSHFESIGSNVQQRQNQLNITFQSLKSFQNAALMGDFNFDSRNGKEEACIPKEWRDVYLDIHKRADCTMPQTMRESEWRPDRILLKTNKYQLKSIQRVGINPIHPYHKDKTEDIQKDGIVRTPSDHFGLHAIIHYK